MTSNYFNIQTFDHSFFFKQNAFHVTDLRSNLTTTISCSIPDCGTDNGLLYRAVVFNNRVFAVLGNKLLHLLPDRFEVVCQFQAIDLGKNNHKIAASDTRLIVCSGRSLFVLNESQNSLSDLQIPARFVYSYCGIVIFRQENGKLFQLLEGRKYSPLFDAGCELDNVNSDLGLIVMKSVKNQIVVFADLTTSPIQVYKFSFVLQGQKRADFGDLGRQFNDQIAREIFQDYPNYLARRRQNLIEYLKNAQNLPVLFTNLAQNLGVWTKEGLQTPQVQHKIVHQIQIQKPKKPENNQQFYFIKYRKTALWFCNNRCFLTEKWPQNAKEAVSVQTAFPPPQQLRSQHFQALVHQKHVCFLINGTLYKDNQPVIKIPNFVAKPDDKFSDCYKMALYHDLMLLCDGQFISYISNDQLILTFVKAERIFGYKQFVLVQNGDQLSTVYNLMDLAKNSLLGVNLQGYELVACESGLLIFETALDLIIIDMTNQYQSYSVSKQGNFPENMVDKYCDFLQFDRCGRVINEKSLQLIFKQEAQSYLKRRERLEKVGQSGEPAAIVSNIKATLNGQQAVLFSYNQSDIMTSFGSLLQKSKTPIQKQQKDEIKTQQIKELFASETDVVQSIAIPQQLVTSPDFKNLFNSPPPSLPPAKAEDFSVHNPIQTFSILANQAKMKQVQHDSTDKLASLYLDLSGTIVSQKQNHQIIQFDLNQTRQNTFQSSDDFIEKAEQLIAIFDEENKSLRNTISQQLAQEGSGSVKIVKLPSFLVVPKFKE